MTSYFITGTDTNVGKTYATCALARRARMLGHRVFAFKPIETGCATSPSGDRIGADQELLFEAAGSWQQGALRGLYRFALPAAPLVAAEAEHASIDLGVVVQTALSHTDASFALVEGAGGWRVPITSDSDMSTLARGLGFPVLVVARAGLGTINHTLLTIEAVQGDGLQIAAVILSQRNEDPDESTDSNRAQILRCWPGRVLILRSDAAALDELIVPRGT